MGGRGPAPLPQACVPGCAVSLSAVSLSGSGAQLVTKWWHHGRELLTGLWPGPKVCLLITRAKQQLATCFRVKGIFILFI